MSIWSLTSQKDHSFPHDSCLRSLCVHPDYVYLSIVFPSLVSFSSFLSLFLWSRTVARVRTVRPRGSTPGTNKNFYLQKSSCLFSGYRGESGRGVNLASNFHLAPRIRKKGAVTPRHAHDFVTWTVPLYCFFIFLFIPVFLILLSLVTFLNSIQFTEHDLYRFARLTSQFTISWRQDPTTAVTPIQFNLATQKISRPAKSPNSFPPLDTPNCFTSAAVSGQQKLSATDRCVEGSLHQLMPTWL
jgi:hypothetical protein